MPDLPLLSIRTKEQELGKCLRKKAHMVDLLVAGEGHFVFIKHMVLELVVEY